MREVVERAEVAARPGAVWRVAREVPDGEAEPAAHVDGATEPRDLAWTSLLPLGDDGVEVQWWFRLAPNWTGTEVEHGVRVPRDLVAAEEVTLRRRLVTRLARLKARAESMT